MSAPITDKVGYLDSVGHWLIDGHQVGQLPNHTVILLWAGPGGRRIKHGWGPQVRVSRAWIGSPAWAGKVRIDCTYRVLWPEDRSGAAMSLPGTGLAEVTTT